MLLWKRDAQGKSALMIDGARRIGKSYIVEVFAKQEYKSYILVDFNRMDDELRSIFERYLTKLDMERMPVSALTNRHSFGWRNRAW